MLSELWYVFGAVVLGALIYWYIKRPSREQSAIIQKQMQLAVSVAPVYVTAWMREVERTDLGGVHGSNLRTILLQSECLGHEPARLELARQLRDGQLPIAEYLTRRLRYDFHMAFRGEVATHMTDFGFLALNLLLPDQCNLPPNAMRGALILALMSILQALKTEAREFLTIRTMPALKCVACQASIKLSCRLCANSHATCNTCAGDSCFSCNASPLYTCENLKTQ